MALSTQLFWDGFYKSNMANEWYFDLDLVAEANSFLQNLLDNPYPVVLHGGCGACTVAQCMKHGYLAEFDFSAAVVKKAAHGTNDTLVIDAFHLPFRDEFCDIIIEKGLFDSVTSRSCTRNGFACALLHEYYRVLCRGGVAVIYSIFGPDSDDKDMLGLLSHPDIKVESHSIYHCPAEIPTQRFCFVYILRKV